MRNVIALSLLFSILISGCGGTHGPVTPVYAPVPDSACGVATVAATALSSDIRFIDPLNLSDAGGLSEHPSIASSSGGNIYVAWDDDKSLNKDVYFKISHDYGGQYQSDINASKTGVNVSKTGGATFPSLGVDSDGVIHVAWRDLNAGPADNLSSGPSEIRYARSIDNGANFTDSIQVSSVNADIDTITQDTEVVLAVASNSVINGKGNIYLAWSEVGAHFAIKIARSIDHGVSFSTVYTYVPPNNANPSYITLVVDSVGNLHMGWAETTNESRYIKYAVSSYQYQDETYTLPITFTSPITLETGSNLSLPTIAVDPTDINRVYVAWMNSIDNRIHFATSGNAGQDFSAFTIALPDSNPLSKQLSPRLASGNDGTIYMAWTDNRSGNYDTYFSKIPVNGTVFETPVSISPSAQGSLFIAISVDDENNIYIAWDDNRYANPPADVDKFGNEGNFEILVARGKFNLPAVQFGSASPCPFTPNGDAKDESTVFDATFSELLNWNLTVTAQDGITQVFKESGSGTSMNTSWNGTNNGDAIEDGIYTYNISGTNADGVVSTTANGSVVLYKTEADAVPVITKFSREAFGFSPNGDGFKDSDGITANFNKPVNWTIEIKDSNKKTVRLLEGSGAAIDSNVTRWDGKDNNGTMLPEGVYDVSLTIIDGLGQSASCGRQPVPCFIMEIDTTRPAIENIALDVTTFNPDTGGTVTISGMPSEFALVTIYVYNNVDVLTKDINRSFREAHVDFQEIWDGTNSSSTPANRVTVTPGTYQFKVWCRDRAGNTALTYPYEYTVTVE